MSQVFHVQCPACGGAVGGTNVDRVITCGYCGVRMLAENDQFVPEFGVTPLFDEVAARRKVQYFLTNDALPKGLLRRARLEHATLCFVPYHQFRSRRLGQLQVTVKESKGGIRRSVMADEPLLIGQETWRPPETIQRRETEMVLHDVERLEPAVQLSSYGVKNTGIYQILKSCKGFDGVEIGPFSRKQAAAQGRVFPPQVSADTFLAQLGMTGYSATVLDDTEYVETRIRRIYYPLWRFHYRVGGHSYVVVVDGVLGDVVYATAPEDDKWRVMAIMPVLALAGMVVGRGARWILQDVLPLGSGTARLAGTISLLALACVMVLSLVFVLAWNQFRYPGQVIKEGDSWVVEKYSGLFGRNSRGPLFTWGSLWRILWGRL